jgi:N-acetylglucosaminyl-diphospho-decaprenol L-rhamnosyltransferase
VDGVRVAAIVLHYHFWPNMRATLDALLSSSRPPDDIIVVDNCGDCGVSEGVAREYPDVRVMTQLANLGYAGGMNAGLHVVAGQFDYVLLLTHECTLSVDALALLLECCAEDGVGATGPLVVNQDGSLWSAGAWYERGEVGKYKEPSSPDAWVGKPPFEVDWVDGCCIMLRSSAIDAVGEFDTRYFMYFEETDFQLALKRQGWAIKCVPKARARQSPGDQRVSIFTRNQLLLISKHDTTKVLALIAAKQIRNTLMDVRQGRYADARSRARGLTAFARRRWGPMR